MTDDLTGLPTLLAVVEKRGFSAAAAALRVTPSTVSQAVRAVEDRVGVSLLQRTTRSVGLVENYHATISCGSNGESRPRLPRRRSSCPCRPSAPRRHPPTARSSTPGL